MKKRTTHEPTLLSQENRDLRQRRQQKLKARAQRAQAAKERAAQLKAQADAILCTTLGGEPVDLAQLEAERKRICGGRHSTRGGWR